MKVMTTNDRRALVASITTAGSGNSREKNLPSAASQALAASDTSSRNPMPTTIVNDQNRCLMTPRTRPQLPEDTPQSPKRSVMAPRPVARRLPPALRALSIAARTASAPASPGEVLDLPDDLARAMMRISPGASAKTV
jgi:hypothetical protein